MSVMRCMKFELGRLNLCFMQCFLHAVDRGMSQRHSLSGN